MLALLVESVHADPITPMGLVTIDEGADLRCVLETAVRKQNEKAVLCKATGAFVWSDIDRGRRSVFVVGRDDSD